MERENLLREKCAPFQFALAALGALLSFCLWGVFHKRMSETKGVHGVWLIVAFVVMSGLMLWGYLDQHHYFYHDKLARITSAAWSSGEAKNCDSWNAKTDPPVLECDGGHSDVQQTVRVRFHGDTRIDLEPDTLRLHWSCRNEPGSNPAITCRIDSMN
jgi:hypothetical protein